MGNYLSLCVRDDNALYEVIPTDAGFCQRYTYWVNMCSYEVALRRIAQREGVEMDDAYRDKAEVELRALADAGVCMSGNAFSQVVLVKGEAEMQGAQLLSGADGNALRAALQALGYAPEDWVGLLALTADGAVCEPSVLRRALTTLDPRTVIALDEVAAGAIRETYADELVELEDLNSAALVPGVVVTILGMRLMDLGGFAASLTDPGAKQLMWARLKQLPPLSEPY